MTPNLVNVILRPGSLADRVTEAFTELLQEPLRADSPHTYELVEHVGADGMRPGRPIKIFPREWIRRLERAVETGAFNRKSPSEIAEAILSTPEPS